MIDIAAQTKELLLETVSIRAEVEEQLSYVTDPKARSNKLNQVFHLDQLIMSLQWFHDEVSGKHG